MKQDPKKLEAGWVPGVDFARSLVVGADLRKTDGLLSRVGGPGDCWPALRLLNLQMVGEDVCSVCALVW